MKRILAVMGILIFCPAIISAETIVRIAPLTTKIVSTATSIAGTAEQVPNSNLVGRENIVIYNKDHATETIWCGDSSVTSSSGIPLDGTTPSMSLDLDSSVDVYCISDSSTVNVITLESK